MTMWSFQEFFSSTNALVIQSSQAPISFATFWQAVADRVVYLQQQPQQHYALWTEDSYLFLSWFWASLIANKTLILPPHRIASLEQQFSAQGILFIDENLIVMPTTQPIETLVSDWQLVADKSQIVFFTSGSTGQPKQIPRTLSQLLKEVIELQKQFKLDQHVVMCASVSHQHIYGLLFKLLLPLMSGAKFLREQLLYPEYIVKIQNDLVKQQYAPYLVASPALLKRCIGYFDFVLSPIIFSSGGQLETGIRAYYPQNIVEVLGSSETGGIATRLTDNAVWQCLADVAFKIDTEQHLWIKTPHAYQPEWIATGDLAQQQDQGFQLLGRHDRIVKLEEKRLSLDAIEHSILALDGVAQCHVLLQQHEQREMLAVVIVCTEALQQTLSTQGKKAIVEQLKQQLQNQLERIAIPRLWRFVAEIPINSQSKIDKTWMQNLFKDLDYPVVLNTQISSDSIVYRIQMLPEMTCYAGHFPNFPVYPGVGQIAFLVKFAQQSWQDLVFCAGYEQLKFQDLIKPYDVLQVTLHRQAHKIIFTMICTDERKIASGRLLFQLKDVT